MRDKPSGTKGSWGVFSPYRSKVDAWLFPQSCTYPADSAMKLCDMKDGGLICKYGIQVRLRNAFCSMLSRTASCATMRWRLCCSAISIPEGSIRCRLAEGAGSDSDKRTTSVLFPFARQKKRRPARAAHFSQSGKFSSMQHSGISFSFPPSHRFRFPLLFRQTRPGWPGH